MVVVDLLQKKSQGKEQSHPAINTSFESWGECTKRRRWAAKPPLKPKEWGKKCESVLRGIPRGQA